MHSSLSGVRSNINSSTHDLKDKPETCPQKFLRRRLWDRKQHQCQTKRMYGADQNALTKLNISFCQQEVPHSNFALSLFGLTRVISCFQSQQMSIRLSWACLSMIAFQWRCSFILYSLGLDFLLCSYTLCFSVWQLNYLERHFIHAALCITWYHISVWILSTKVNVKSPYL